MRGLSVEVGSIEEGVRRLPKWTVRRAQRRCRSLQTRRETCCVTITRKPGYDGEQERSMALGEQSVESKEELMRLGQLNNVQSYGLRPRTDVSEDVQPGASDAGR